MSIAGTYIFYVIGRRASTLAAFVDGNKRIGMYVLLTFLETNGVKIRPTNEEVARVGLVVAAGKMKYQELLDWIIEN